MDNCQNSNLNIEIDPSKSRKPKKRLANTRYNRKADIELTIVELSDGLGELINSPNVGLAEKRKIAVIEESFCKLFHQIVDTDNIRKYCSHDPRERTPLNCLFWESGRRKRSGVVEK